MSFRWRPHPDLVQQEFVRQRTVDPFGHRLQALFAALWGFLACGPVSVIEFGWSALAFCFLIRFHRHQCTHAPLRQTVGPWLVVAWTIWQGVAVLWSLDRRAGLEEWGVMRFAIPVLLIWPTLDRRNWLIAGVALGLLCANLAQVSHAIGRAMDIPALTFDRLPGRNSGWWQPVVAGTMLTAGVGLHLPAALTGSGKWRWIGIVGLLASVTGVAATGSRGAWIATTLLLCLGGAWALRRFLSHGFSLKRLAAVAAVIVAIGAVGYVAVWPSMRARAVEGVHEIERMVKSDDYTTYTGARIEMARWGWRALCDEPVWGIGVGSFRRWVAREMEQQGQDPLKNPAHAHCHNTFLHVAATTGLVGLLIFGGITVLSIRGGFARDGERPGAIRSYEAGPAFALIGMVLVTPFDVVNVNAQTAALWWILVAMCTWGRPQPVEAATPTVPDAAKKPAEQKVEPGRTARSGE